MITFSFVLITECEIAELCEVAELCEKGWEGDDAMCLLPSVLLIIYFSAKDYELCAILTAITLKI